MNSLLGDWEKERRGAEIEGDGKGTLDALPRLMVLMFAHLYRVRSPKEGQ